MRSLSSWLRSRCACTLMLDWAEQGTSGWRETWELCPHSDWMFDFMALVGVDPLEVALFWCNVARTMLVRLEENNVKLDASIHQAVRAASCLADKQSINVAAISALVPPIYHAINAHLNYITDFLNGKHGTCAAAMLNVTSKAVQNKFLSYSLAYCALQFILEVGRAREESHDPSASAVWRRASRWLFRCRRLIHVKPGVVRDAFPWSSIRKYLVNRHRRRKGPAGSRMDCPKTQSRKAGKGDRALSD